MSCFDSYHFKKYNICDFGRFRVAATKGKKYISINYLLNFLLQPEKCGYGYLVVKTALPLPFLA